MQVTGHLVGCPFVGAVGGHMPRTVASPRDAVHAAPPWEPQPTSGWHVFYFVLLSHLQTQEVTLRKGRQGLPGGRAGLPSPVQPGWTLGTFCRETVPDLEGPHCRLAHEVVSVVRCSSVPGRCVTWAASAQGFIAGEPDYPTWVRMTASSEMGPVGHVLLR